MRRGTIAWLSLLAVGATTPALANDFTDCGQFANTEATIRGCSAVIAGGRANRATLATAYANRGGAYAAKGNLDSALADAGKALELNPKYVDAHVLRGIILAKKGDYDGTVADETLAIDLAPQNAIAYENRAFAYSEKGDYDRAIADETRALEIDPRNAGTYNGRAFAYGQKGDPDREIADATKAIELNPRLTMAYNNRGAAYGTKGDFDHAVTDLRKAIELDPRSAKIYDNLAFAYMQKGDVDTAVADDTKAIELSPQFALAYGNRGAAYIRKRDYDRAIADETRSIAIDPRSMLAYVNRGFAYRQKGDYDNAIADENKAIELNPNNPMAFANRGYAYGGKGDYDRELADQSKAIALKADLGPAYYGRAEAYAAKGEPAQALVDFRVAAPLLPTSDERHGQALARIGDLERQLASAAPRAGGPAVAPERIGQTAGGNSKSAATQTVEARPEPLPPPVKVPPVAAVAETRLALVIGNSSYAAVAKLPNPERDADTIAAALQADGFAVTKVDNLARADFIAAINRFSDDAAKADWAVIYFAGHGLQLDGVNYLIPVDARLNADRDVQDEAIALDRLINAVGTARKLGLVIVDACRNNPFLNRMHFTIASRAAHTRGLARIEPQGTTLVEFSARDGEEALDGDASANSPFAAALAKRLLTPGLEVGKLLRQVREDVYAATEKKQEPMFSGDLPAEDVFFRAAE
jgi:tetratricopeptide (TPR) repeat protein